MRVLLNTLTTLGHKTGIGRYTAELYAGLRAELAAGETLDTFPAGWLRTGCSWLRSQMKGGGGGGGTGKRSWRGWMKEQAGQWWRNFLDARFAGALRRHAYDLYHEPNNVPLPARVPTVVTLHDLSVLLYPQWHPAERVAYYERCFRDGLSRCAHILTDTEAVRREIIRHLGVAPERVTAAHLGVQPDLRPVAPEVVAARLRALKLPASYLLSVGTLEPRKNQLMLVRAYCRLPASVRERYPLLLVGGLGWNNGDLRACLDGEGKRAGVLHLGYVPDADLATIYSGARALLFPSFYEGFGFPPLEMQACGGAVVASTAAAVAEVCAGSPALLLDPHDADAWHDALLRVCKDDDFHASLCSGATTAAARFTWRRCAAETLAVYRKVASPACALKRSA